MGALTDLSASTLFHIEARHHVRSPMNLDHHAVKNLTNSSEGDLEDEMSYGEKRQPRNTEVLDTWVEKPYWKWILQSYPSYEMPRGLEVSYSPELFQNP